MQARFCLCFFLAIPVRPIILESTGPMIAKFSGLAVDCQSEIIFLITQGTLPCHFCSFYPQEYVDMYFCGVIHRTDLLNAGG